MQNPRLFVTLMLMLTLLTWTVVYSPTAEASVDWIELHGPEKPPPDDGYEFKGANGGNGLGKLGLAAMGAGVVTALLFVTADADSERKDNMGKATVGLMGGGLGLLVIERLR